MSLSNYNQILIALSIGILVSGSIAAMDMLAEKSEVTPQYHALGCIPEKLTPENSTIHSLAPPSWDWRSEGIMTPVKNQAGCGACVAFACCGAFEAVIKWKTGDTVDLSEAHLFFCSGGTCDNGEYVSDALNYLKNYGTPDEDCFPYDGAAYGNDLSCSDTCSDWEQRAYKIKDWGYISTSSIKDYLVNYGPLVVTYAVYQDFDDYWNDPSAWPDEVYYHHYGDLRGYHAVVLVGYDDNGGYWICRNSWGTSGGLNGYFKIKYGEPAGSADLIDDGAYYLVYEPQFRADAGGPYHARPGETVQFHGSASGGTEPYTWSWNFGDGGTSTEKNPTHVYSNAGIYTVTLTVQDANGKVASSTTKAIINTPPSKPSISGPTSDKINSEVAFQVKAHDDDGDKVRYYIDWGDGRNTKTSYYASDQTVTVSHIWFSKGSYTIRVRAEDERGGHSSWEYHSIKIGASEPPYQPYDPYPPDNATSVKLSTKLSWKGGDPEGENVYYTVYFGEDPNNLTKIADNISTNYTYIAGLHEFTRYYWQVIAWDESGMFTAGPVWNFITLDVTPPSATIVIPAENTLYAGNISIKFFKTFVIGKINVVVNANDTESGIDRVEFYVDGELVGNDTTAPYTWLWNEDTLYDTHTLEIIAYDRDGNTAKDSMEVTVFNPFP